MITPWLSDTESQQLALLKVRLAVINETIPQLRYCYAPPGEATWRVRQPLALMRMLDPAGR
jgi:hypothetical protein